MLVHSEETMEQMLEQGCEEMEAWMMKEKRLKMKNQKEDDMVACLLAYMIYCTARNECYLLREEKKAITIVLRYGRRLDP